MSAIVACQCLNIQVRYINDKNGADTDNEGELRVKLAEGDDAVTVALPPFAGRELLSLQSLGLTSPIPALRCLHCGTTVYAVEKPASLGPTRSVGFQPNGPARPPSTEQQFTSGNGVVADSSPSRAQAQYSKEASLRPHDGHVYLQHGVIGEEEIRRIQESASFSPIYNVAVSSAAPVPSESNADPQEPITRPSLAQSRRSSIGQYGSVSQYGLQGLPTYLVSTPPGSPAPATPPATAGASASSSSLLTHAIGLPNPLAAHLDAAGIDKLKQWRLTAEQDIMDIVRKKRKDFDTMVRRAKIEAEAVLERSRGVPAPAPRGRVASLSAGNLGGAGRSRDSSVSVPGHSVVADRSSSTALVESTSSSMTTSTDEEYNTTLPNSAFERRNPLASVRAPGAQSNFSSSLSALSASFAMRGNDRAGINADEWAQKKRLKERYPEGDHSVMTSAATSAANSDLDDGGPDSDDEEEEEIPRGRGREREIRAPEPNTIPKANIPASSEMPTRAANMGTTSEAPGTRLRPTMAPSSLSSSSKALASTLVDFGRDRDSDTPQPGGPLGLPPSVSADIHLRPRNPPPSGAEPLKPATRQGSDRSQKRSSGTAEAKKVAFAETPDQAQAPASPQFEFNDGQHETVHGPEEPVFDIDEEMEPADDEAQSGEANEGQTARKKALRGAAAKLLEDDVAADGAFAREDDEEADELGGVRASIGAQQAGSLSALAASLQRSSGLRRDDVSSEGLDPASLRLDGRVVAPSRPSPSQSRSGSRSRISPDLGASQITSDYDAGGKATSPEKKRRGHDWGGRAAIGYRAIGDVELRLSGLLAPHAPSHRALWSTVQRQRRIPKYELEKDDTEEVKADASPQDTQWFAWQERAKKLDDAKQSRKTETEQSNALAQSLPLDRNQRYGGSLVIPKPTPGQLRRTGSTTYYDETSGFDREPKTSLPYQERQMVPSLRKATRKALAHASKPVLPTIVDEKDETSTDDAALPQAEEASSAQAKAGAIAVTTHLENAAASPSPARVPSVPGATSFAPGSVVTRGFALPHQQGQQESTQGAAQPPGADPHQPTAKSLTSAGIAEKSSSSLAPPAESPALQSGVSTPASIRSHADSNSSSRGTPSGRRSPRPPYVPPPPPTSTTTVLQPDPMHKPTALQLFKAKADASFAYNEIDEEEETDWSKVLSFMHRVEKLKVNKRTGWLHHRVPRAESIADHMYRMAMLAMLCPKDIDIGKAVMLALVHDLAEAEVGDLTPLDGVSKEEKMRREAEALAYLVHDLLGSSPAALRIEALWHEYEDRETLESKLVKDLDRFELILQAVEYERAHDIVDLQPFFSCAADVQHPRVRKWTVELAKERQEMWKARGPEWYYEQPVPSDDEVRGDGKGGREP